MWFILRFTTKSYHIGVKAKAASVQTKTRLVELKREVCKNNSVAFQQTLQM